MNPAPPEITALGLLAADTSIGEAKAAHDRGVVDVATVNHHGFPHGLLDSSKVQVTEFVPLRYDHHGVGAVCHLVRTVHVLDIRQDAPRSLHGCRIVSTHQSA